MEHQLDKAMVALLRTLDKPRLMTSGAPKKSRVGSQAGGTIIDGLLGCGKVPTR
jgi:hypothetical protein